MESQKIEEIIERIGAHLEMRSIKLDDLRIHNIEKKDIDVLKNTGIIIASDNGTIKFTDSGEKKYSILIRNHRLAERMMMDVLVTSEKDAESVACGFEHFLNPTVADSICTLLGHPSTCPHGKPIPSGECCSDKNKKIGPVITSLNNLKAGETGQVAYIAMRNHARLHKLSSMGIMPGKTLKMHQTRPAIVVIIEETTLSMDNEIAGEIFVRV